MAFLLTAVALVALVTAEPSASSGNSTSPSSSGGSSSQYQNHATQAYLDELNESLGNNYLWALLCVVAVVFGYSSIKRLNRHVRHLASMNNGGAQRYFALASPAISWLNDHLLHAPIFHYRRATELRFSRHITFGTLPSRFQSAFIGFMVIYNVFACTWEIPWSDLQLQVLPILRNRSGCLSVVNLLPIVVMASIKNPLIYILDISYDSFNLMHRWLGRISILQAITHTLCYIIVKVQSQGWKGMKHSVQTPFIYYGLAGTIGLTVIFHLTPKVLRALAYEVFLYVHIVVVIVTFAFLWMHLDGLSQRAWLLGAIVIWAVSRGWRLATLIYRSIGREGCDVVVEAMPGEALRISLSSPRPWKYQPGQSLYLSIPSVGWLTAHPFSVAWSGVEDSLSRSGSVRSDFDEKAPVIRKRAVDVELPGKQTINLVVKARSGMTRALYERAERAGALDGAKLSLKALVEGPYGVERSLSSYGTVMLFASGVGITHQIPYVRQLVEGYRDGTVATRRVTLVWAIPHTECLEWIRPWMHEILAIEKRREVLKIVLHITRAGLSQPIRSPSESVRMLRGRPDVEFLMKKEANEKVGCMGVSVCAGGGLADEVRRSSRVLAAKGVNLDFIEQGFGW